MSLIYPGGDEQVTPNIGLATWGMDEVLAENMILIDSAIAGGGSSVKVNGVSITNPNFNGTTPAAPGGSANIVFQVDGSGNVSAYYTSGGGGAVTSVFGRTGAVTAQSGDYSYAQISGTPQLPVTISAVAHQFLTSYTSGTGAFTQAALVSGDIPNNAANTSGTAANLSGTPALPNGAAATTQSAGDNSTKIATDAFVLGQGFVTASTAPVTSVFTRTGAVTAQAGDYTAAQVGAIATSLMTTLGDIIYENATPAPARLAGNITTTKMYLSQTGNASISAAPVWAQINYADITGTTPTPPSGSVLWSALGNAGANLSLSNAGFTTTFNQTSAVAWLWANTTTGTSGTTNASPLLELAAQYYTGATGATDLWTIGSSLAAGTNGVSTLSLVHTGSSGSALIAVPSNNSTTVPNYTFTGATGTGIGNQTNSLNLISGAASPIINFCNNAGLFAALVKSGSSASFSVAGSTQLVLLGNIGTTANTPSVMLGQNTNSFTGTAGLQTAVAVGGTSAAPIVFAPTSGSATFLAFQVFPTINQTGSSSGNYTACQIAVKETALKGTVNILLDLEAGTSGTTPELQVNNTGIVSLYNQISTVSNGVPSELAKADFTAQTAAIGPNSLVYTAVNTGMFRVSWSAAITTASDGSSVLGGSTGFQVVYTSPTDSVVKTTVSGNSVTSAANTTGTAVGGAIVIYAKTGTQIGISYGYTSVQTTTAMAYEIHVKVEAM